MENITIKLSNSSKSIEVSAPAEFIKAELPKLIESIQLAQPVSVQTVHGPAKQSVLADPGELSDVYHLEGSDVHVSMDIPGNKKAEKMVNAAIIYLYGKEKHLGKGEATKKELIELCRKHGCLDSANFATRIKKATKFLVVKGANVSLTRPGSTEAQRLISPKDVEQE